MAICRVVLKGLGCNLSSETDSSSPLKPDKSFSVPGRSDSKPGADQQSSHDLREASVKLCLFIRVMDLSQ